MAEVTKATDPAGRPGSPPPRPPIRSIEETRPEAPDGADRLKKRIAAIRKARESLPATGDEFHVPPDRIPDGWSYEWKRKSTLGKEDPFYLSDMARAGWSPVPASRHPDLLPIGYDGDNIEFKGLILMERPRVFTDEARRSEASAAREAVLAKERAMGANPKGEFDRTRPTINRHHGPVTIGDE